MTRLATSASVHPLGSHEGRVLLSGPQAILKAALECERDVALLTGPRSGEFTGLFSAASDEGAPQLLRQHGMNVLSVPQALRGIMLALQSANSGRASIALVPNAQLDVCRQFIESAQRSGIQNSGAVCFILEDQPSAVHGTCPRLAAMRIGIPCFEPGDVGQLRDQIESALRVSRVGSTPVAIVVHSMILRSSQTLEMRPNRVLSSMDVVLARRRRKSRSADSSVGRDVMRLVRRMELNLARCMPNPGERVPVGFVTVGPSEPSVAHLAEALHLHGRLPVVQLGMIHPIDDALVGRLLNRCEQVVVLESRPTAGAVEQSVLHVAESMRRRGERAANVWGRDLPPTPDGAAHHLENDEANHPSVLARRVLHLLHAIRPTMQVATRLVSDPPPPTMQTMPRGADIGINAAVSILRRMATDVDQWLRGQTAQLKERGVEPTVLAIDGIDPASTAGAPRVVPVEFLAGRTWQATGMSAIRQAARENHPWVMIACDFADESGDHPDVERYIRGIIPGERTDHVTVEVVNMNDRAHLRERLEYAVQQQRLTILIVRDGPPAQFDLALIERTLTELDRIGFQPRQRLIWSAEQACLFARPSEDEEEDSEQDSNAKDRKLQSEVTVDRAGRQVEGIRLRVKVQPLLEQIEVIRTKPPAWIWRSALTTPSVRLDLPSPRHRKQPVWRAHIAGWRGAAPGVASLILQEAGRNMGYDVAAIHDLISIASGRRAWSQIVFTRPLSDASAISHPRIVAAVPYGEVDLLVGFDVHETIRAINPRESLRVAHHARTTLVANTGIFSDEPGADERELTPAMHTEFLASLAAISMDDARAIEDFASVCRAWFHTDRVTDIVMLGVAFQRGLIPVNLEAIEQAVARMESRGYGRSSEAFQFGRHLAVDEKLMTKPRDEREDDLEAMIRRMTLGLRGSRWRGMSHAREFDGLIRRSLDAMPGLAETHVGRQAQRDFVTAVYRAIQWSDVHYAQQYADLMTSLYQVDRGETGRVLTRCAVLPLADAMLIHDPIYIACMATNPEQQRRLRQRLNIKHARGDSIERRYLTRLELTIRDRRFRADVRTSDWPARLARLLRHVVPTKWRGGRREREIRAYVMEFVRRATYEAANDIEKWNDSMKRLHNAAESHRLRDMAIAELKMLAEPGGPLRSGSSD